MLFTITILFLASEVVLCAPHASESSSHGVPNVVPKTTFGYRFEELEPEIIKPSSFLSHECDTILVGGEQDVCAVDPGCELKSRHGLSHQFFGKSVFLCDGIKADDPSKFVDDAINNRLPLDTLGYRGDSIDFVYTYSGTRREAARTIYRQQGILGGSSHEEREVLLRNSWSYIVFRNYTDGSRGLLSSDCFSDIVADVKEAARGSLQGDKYVYTTTRGGHPDFCTKSVAVRNFADVCGYEQNVPGKRCIDKIVPLHGTYNTNTGAWADSPWEKTLELCSSFYKYYKIIAIGYNLGFRRIDDTDKFTPCKLSFHIDTRRRSLPVKYAEHGMWNSLIHTFVGAIETVFVRVIEPVFRKIIAICFTVVKDVLWFPLQYLLNAMLDSTVLFLGTLIIVIFGCVCIYVKANKLTSPFVNVRVIEVVHKDD